MSKKKETRLRRAKRTRMSIKEQQIKNPELARMVVIKSPRHIAVQVVQQDPLTLATHVVTQASTQEADLKQQCKNTGNIEAAKVIGKVIGERLAELKGESLNKIAFDRSGYKYHGRVQALVDAAREAGVEF